MEAAKYVSELVEKARVAQAVIENYTQEQVDALCKAMAKAIFDNAEPLARMAVDETGMGVYEDKVNKNKGKARVIWSDMKGGKSVGIIRQLPELGLTEVAKPMGVVGAITPTTNPIVTPMCNAMFALKGRNAIIVGPHPRSKKCSTRACELMQEAIVKLGAPADLLQCVAEPTIEISGEIMKQCDVCISTGGAGMVKAAYASGKPAYGVGGGNVQCIIDDDVDKIGNTIGGIKVVGTTYEIKKFAKKYDVDEIHVTMPSIDKSRLSKIITRCNDAGCPVKILPGLYQLADGQVSVSKMREVDIQDLLGRDPVTVDINAIIGYIEDKVVLVTGGGGSIGSELCRQIASHNPKKLIILDIYENNAYDIEQELKRKHHDLNLLTLIASVRDIGKIKSVFETYRPEIVFHAAAHKHVPLMETSPNEAVKNNVFGTFNVARFADQYGVETFVQISTDKAVNPTNVMGATKRICEMIIQAFGRHSKTKFVAVRFGNVLGSNGSVIPLFKKQIKEGGPVTVTHKDIIRYFMTIPEAVSLVLQAGAYAKGGQIFVLDMGEPVRIYDLAYNLIKLSGYTPNVDILIECTGLRPGEKLFEERLMDEEGMQKTPNGLINIAQPLKFDEASFWTTLNELYEAAYSETDRMKYLLRDIVPTYRIDERK